MVFAFDISDSAASIAMIQSNTRSRDQRVGSRMAPSVVSSNEPSAVMLIHSIVSEGVDEAEVAVVAKVEVARVC
jgi:hypothetical protein